MTRPARFSTRMWQDAPGLTGTAALIATALVPLCLAMALDTRLFQDESVWLKPVKFHVAVAVYLITLAFFARFVPQARRHSRRFRSFFAVVCTSAILELLWVDGAASVSIASHFNTQSAWMTAAYGLAGVFAVLLTSGSLGIGIAIWRNPGSGLDPAVHRAIWLGLILTFVLTVIVAGTLSGNGSHFVGTSTRELAVLGWSRDAGDLRIAHLLATHAMHALPVTGLIAARTLRQSTANHVVTAAAVVYSVLVFATFFQALAGQPLIS